MHAAVFHDAKQRLMSSQVLVHFNSSLEIRLACDASDYVVLGSEKPVVFISRTLNKAEKRYSRIEGLACVVGVGFIRICTDIQPYPKPLLTEWKLVSQQVSNRI